jgi:flagellar biosynthesis/type III secretory pathway M-ring protein FliF/YscJ
LQEIRIEYESRVRRAVLAVLPDHVDAASAVTVTSFDEPVPATNPPWIDVANWQRSVRQQPVRVAVVAVACVVVLACATMLRKRRPERVLEPSTIPMNGYQPASSEARLARLDSPAEMDESQLRETLANLVREDPDGAAKILHRWLDRAG